MRLKVNAKKVSKKDRKRLGIMTKKEAKARYRALKKKLWLTSKELDDLFLDEASQDWKEKTKIKH